MTIGALAAYQIGHQQDGAIVAATMLLTALSLSHLAGALLTRDQRNTIFSRAAIPGSDQLQRYGIALLAIIAVTTIDFLAADLRHHRPEPHPVVHLHRPRGLPDRRRRADQAHRPTPPARVRRRRASVLVPARA